jgi:hypothetical protein
MNSVRLKIIVCLGALSQHLFPIAAKGHLAVGVVANAGIVQRTVRQPHPGEVVQVYDDRPAADGCSKP